MVPQEQPSSGSWLTGRASSEEQRLSRTPRSHAHSLSTYAQALQLAIQLADKHPSTFLNLVLLGFTDQEGHDTLQLPTGTYVMMAGTLTKTV